MKLTHTNTSGETMCANGNVVNDVDPSNKSYETQVSNCHSLNEIAPTNHMKLSFQLVISEMTFTNKTTCETQFFKLHVLKHS